MRSHHAGSKDGRRAVLSGAPGPFLGGNRQHRCARLRSVRAKLSPPSRSTYPFLMEPGASPT